MKSFYTALLCLGFFVPFAGAQTVCLAFSPTTLSGNIGDTVDLQVIAVQFDTIGGMQFPILFDKEVLEVITVVVPEPPPLNNFFYSAVSPTSIAHPLPGKIALVWFDPIGQGNTMPPGTLFFTVRFKVIGAGSSSVQIANAPPPSISFFGGQPAFGNVNFVNPCVSGQQNLPVSKDLSVLVAPNPFSSTANIVVNSETDADAQLIVTDLRGRICFQKNIYLNQGITGTEIANTQLQGAGMYFVHIVTGRAHAVQPIVIQ